MEVGGAKPVTSGVGGRGSEEIGDAEENTEAGTPMVGADGVPKARARYQPQKDDPPNSHGH